MSQSLTLYDLSAELVSLMDDWDDPETSPETRSQIEVQLRAYADAHVQKVDDIRNYMRHLAVMETALREEAATQKAGAEACKARLEWLKAYCCEVMVQHGAKRWDGRTGALLCKGNGGKQRVVGPNGGEPDPAMVPDEFCVYELPPVPMWVWDLIINFIVKSGNEELLNWMAGLRPARTPRKSLIEAELQKPCERCQGGGGIVGEAGKVLIDCPMCGGSGKRGVPGCRLEPRGQHIEVK